jgi:hypothetical protein
MSATQHISMVQGETYAASVTVKDVNGAVIDLTGYDIRYEADTTTPIVKDLDDGNITVSAPATGVFTFTIDPEDTEDLTIEGSRGFAHECRVESPTGEITVLFTGRLLVAAGVIDEMDPTA